MLGSLNLQVHTLCWGRFPKACHIVVEGTSVRQLLQPVMRPFYYGSTMEMIPHEIGE